MSWLEGPNKGRQIGWQQVDGVVLNAMFLRSINNFISAIDWEAMGSAWPALSLSQLRPLA
jgi:hypothetical protein